VSPRQKGHFYREGAKDTKLFKDQVLHLKISKWSWFSFAYSLAPTTRAGVAPSR
jgi:hypothetical protein